MGMVMLYRQDWHIELPGVLCRKILRVEVAGNLLGVNLVELFKTFNHLLKGVKSLFGLQITYVLAQKNTISYGQRYRVFQMPTDRQNSGLSSRVFQSCVA